MEKEAEDLLAQLVFWENRRKEAGVAIPEEIESGSKIFAEHKQVALERFRNSQEILRKAAAIKEAMQGAGINLSRPLLCKTLIEQTVTEGFDEQMQNFFKQKKTPLFRLFYDVTVGMQGVLSPIEAAEEEIRGNFDNMVSEMLPLETKQSVPLSVEKYLSIRKGFEKISGLLKIDTTGFSLVDAYVESIKRQEMPLVKDFQSREYVVLGAEFARDLYKTTYQAIASLYPNSPPARS